MTIHSEIELLEDTRQGLIDALIAKGQSVAQTDTMASYIPKIGNIPSGPQETGIQYLLKEIVEGTVEDINDSTLTILRSNCLQACKNLMSAKFTALLKIAAQAFYSCTKLYTLILDTDDMVFLENINAFQFTPIGMGTGNIYVPDALLATYRDDETWGHFYSQILPLSHYYSENCDIPLEYYSKQNVIELPTENIAKYCLYTMSTSFVDLVNKGQFVAGNTKCLETFTIQAGTTWNVKIDNTSGWYSSGQTTEDPETGEQVPVKEPTELTLNWTFERDTTINITQVYPLLNSYMFSESGQNNIVVLTAQPGITIADTDEVLKFVAVTTENDWSGATHITLNKVEVDSQTSATEGWTDYINAFDSNDQTYATCGTNTDYLQIQYDLPVYIAGFTASGQFATGTTSCNMSLSTYDTDTEVLVATGTGAADTATYTTSATFDDLYARTLRFKLTNSTAGTAPSTTSPTRISEVTLTVDPDSKMRIENVTDGVNNVTTSYENRTGTWDIVTQTVQPEDITVRDLPHENYYYPVSWTQPVLTSNNTQIPGGTIVASASNVYNNNCAAWCIMRGRVVSTVDNGYWQLNNSLAEQWCQIQLPYPLRISQVYVTTRPRDNYTRNVNLYADTQKKTLMGSISTNAPLREYSFNLTKTYDTKILRVVVLAGSGSNQWYGLQNLRINAQRLFEIYI